MTARPSADRGGTLHGKPCPYPIRTYEQRDEAAVLALLRRTFGDTAASKKTTEFWRWKHYATPFGPSYSICAWDDEKAQLVGVRTMMWWSFRSRGGAPLRAVRAVDTATHPDYQRKGVFSALTRVAVDSLCNQGVHFIFNTPNDRSLPGYLKMGWRIVARWPLYVRPVAWLRTGAKLLTRAWRDDATCQDVVMGSALTSWQHFRGEHDADLQEMITAHETRRRCVGNRTERTLSYLDWRYGSHPDITYGVHALHDQTGLAGIIVARPARGVAGLRALVITEMFLRTPTPQAAVRLLSSLLRTSTSDYVLAHFGRGTLERQALVAAGFARALGRGSTFVARPLHETTDDPTRADSWDLTLGELELL